METSAFGLKFPAKSPRSSWKIPMEKIPKIIDSANPIRACIKKADVPIFSHVFPMILPGCTNLGDLDFFVLVVTGGSTRDGQTHSPSFSPLFLGIQQFIHSIKGMFFVQIRIETILGNVLSLAFLTLANHPSIFWVTIFKGIYCNDLRDDRVQCFPSTPHPIAETAMRGQKRTGRCLRPPKVVPVSKNDRFVMVYNSRKNKVEWGVSWENGL